MFSAAWGAQAFGDVPVASDYDGDGKTDVAIYRSATGEWYVRRSQSGTLQYVPWGSPALADLPPQFR